MTIRALRAIVANKVRVLWTGLNSMCSNQFRAQCQPKSVSGARLPYSNAEFRIIPNAGHLAPLENPKAVSEAMEGFLALV